MKYKGIELTPITEPQIFNPPKEMFVWDDSFTEADVKHVCAITGSHHYQVVTTESCYDCCAEIPEEQKPKRATNLQLVEWIAKGNGVFKNKVGNTMFVNLYLPESQADIEVDENYVIRPFGTTEWLEPTLKNMGIVNHEQEKEEE